MRRDAGPPHGAPPWWPEREPWPPIGRSRRRLHPRLFMWRAGLLTAPLLILTIVGATRLLGWVLEEVGLAHAGAPSGRGPLWVAWPVASAVVIFIVVMRRVGRPLGEVVHAADRVGDGDFSVRVRESGSPWVRSLGRAFNSMTAGLERQQRQRRDLMADVAHELRTPLAVMQGRLEGMLDGVYPRDEAQVTQILDETRRLARLVEDLRTLAHSEGGTLALRREPTDLAALLEDAAASIRPEAGRRQVTVAVRVAGELPLTEIDPVRIREVITNLLTNALRYVGEGGSISIAARAEKTIVVEVSDNGPGIDAEALPHVFDRFYKGKGSSGSGLGLAIAHNLVVAHGGTITALSPVPSAASGTTITFTLPVS